MKIMILFVRTITAIAIIIVGAMDAMAIEKPEYEVVIKDNKFEIRDYPPQILAETIVKGDLEGAGNIAFNRLFRYISGKNRSRIKINMTAPVSQVAAGEKIEMTAPVGQQRVREGWAVSFMMPSLYTLETIPEPEDPTISIRQVPSQRIATVRYSGRWTESAYLRYKSELESWVHKRCYTIVGAPIWARYNPPFTPWFLRRNEILIPIDEGTEK